jgi:hypothetical protein
MAKDFLIGFFSVALPEKPLFWKILPFVAFAYPDRNCGCSGPKPPADGAPNAN